MAGAAQHPGNDYFVQPTTGTIQRQSNPLLQVGLETAGFQGPMTWDQAQGVLDLNRKVEQKYGSALPVTTVKDAATGNTGSLPNPLSGLQAIGDFFSRLTQASTWIRVAEVAVGAALIIVALAKLASGTPVGRAAAKAGKAAMIL